MTLRRKLLIAFTAFAVVPLCALGLLNHLQTMRGLESLLARQTATLAERAAREIGQRVAVQRSDLLLLAQNLETRRLLEAHAARDTVAFARARAAADPYLRQLWAQYSAWYHSIELRDARGATVYALGDDATRPVWAFAAEDLQFREPVPDGLGEVVVRTKQDALLPPDVLEPSFGDRGYTMVVDRAAGRVLYPAVASHVRVPSASTLLLQLADDTASGGHLRLDRGDSLRIASHAQPQDVPWSVIATASLAEFAPPFARVRTVSLLALLVVTAAVFVAFTAATRRATRNLHALTQAADAVGRGDFTPALPPAGSDEVGRLTSAFALMTTQVREMMSQIERSRQMAAIGAFAAEVAHEIRNPLTSVKLNLQRIERLVERGRAGADAARPLAIALREIDRLERVVRGVLHLGRPRALERAPCEMHQLIARALDTIAAAAQQRHVRIVTQLDAVRDSVLGDAELLHGALLNVMLNGLDAMPDGGELHVRTLTRERGDGSCIEILVADTGAGIAPALRERLFQPFFTTKPDGTGLGLAMTLRTLEEHGGTIALAADGVAGTTGAAFRIELPLARVEALV